MNLRERVGFNISEMGRIIRRDWTTLPFLGTATAGFVVAVLDFVFLQGLRFQVYSLAGLIVLLVGGYLRVRARFELRRKAGFGSLAGTSRLQIVEHHQLVKDGLYGRVRHPLYLGETLRNFGFVMVFLSVYGMLLIAVSTVFLLFRMGIEERMLVEAFGEEYREYQRRTKRLIPYVY